MGIYYEKEIVIKNTKNDNTDKSIDIPKTSGSKKSSKKPSKKSSAKTSKLDKSDKSDKLDKTNSSEKKIITKKQKIIIRTPKMIAPFRVKEFDNNGRKSYQVYSLFNTMTNIYNEEDIKKFHAFIKKTDTINEETVLEYKDTWKLPEKYKYVNLSKNYPKIIHII